MNTFCTCVIALGFRAFSALSISKNFATFCSRESFLKAAMLIARQDGSEKSGRPGNVGAFVIDLEMPAGLVRVGKPGWVLP
jgi:hypothetical protein